MSVVGFDIGSDNSYICMAKGTGFEVVGNDFSHRYNMSVLSFTEERRLYGVPADEKMLSDFKASVKYVKNLIGLQFDDPFAVCEMEKTHTQFVRLPNGEIGVKVMYLKKETIFSLIQILSMTLSHLKEVAQLHTTKIVCECVISVPVFFTDYQRHCVLEAAKIAGLGCQRLLNEGLAACLAMAVFRANWDEYKKIALIDVGSTNVTATIAEVKQYGVKILSSVCSTTCSGKEVEQCMLRNMSQDFLEKNKAVVKELSMKAKLKLLKQCMLAKKKISVSPKISQLIHIDCFVGDDLDFSSKVSYDEIVSSLPHFQPEMCNLLTKSLAMAGLTIADIQLVELVGGASRFPLYTDIIGNFFNQPVSKSLNAEEAVANGCGLVSGILSPFVRIKEIDYHDLMHHDITIQWKKIGNEKTSENQIFKTGQSIPSTKALMLYRKQDFEIEVIYSSEFPVRSERYLISGVKPDEKGEESKVTIKFRIDPNENFSVLHATITVKQLKPASEVKSPVASSNPDIAVTPETIGSESTEPLKEEIPPKMEPVPVYINKTVDLKVTCLEGFHAINRKPEIDQCIQIELEMQQQIKKMEARNSELNKFEDLLYRCDEGIKGDFKDYLKDEDILRLRLLIDQNVEWIETVKYNKSHTLEMCLERRKEIDILTDEAINRKGFFLASSSFLQESEKVFVKCKKLVADYCSGSENYIHIDAKIIESLERKVENSIKQLMELYSILNAPLETRAKLVIPDLNDYRYLIQDCNDSFLQIMSIPKSTIVPPPIVEEPKMEANGQEGEIPGSASDSSSHETAGDMEVPQEQSESIT